MAGEFLECHEVFGRGYWYGTLVSEVTPSLRAGKSIVLEIDVQGAMEVVERYPQALTIFVHPSSHDELERRLRGRGSGSRAGWLRGRGWLRRRGGHRAARRQGGLDDLAL